MKQQAILKKYIGTIHKILVNSKSKSEGETVEDVVVVAEWEAELRTYEIEYIIVSEECRKKGIVSTPLCFFTVPLFFHQ